MSPRRDPFTFAYLGVLAWITTACNYRVDLCVNLSSQPPKPGQSVATSPTILRKVGEALLSRMGSEA